MSLVKYRKKRDFTKTAEPPPASGKKKKKLARSRRPKGAIFVVQKHAASHLHYDFRLELDGALKSWAVPKGPSLNPKQKRLAVEVEDHPIDYAEFEGRIPDGEYGGGDVIVWDRGTWDPPPDAKAQIRKGRLEFDLHGEKLRGRWVLVRTRGESRQPQWLLIKRTDAEARSGAEIVDVMPLSAKSGRAVEMRAP